jgi:hypothetical protein
MHYWYPPRWILSGNAQIPVNTKLSELDKIWISRYYGNPPPETQTTEQTNPTTNPITDSTTTTNPTTDTTMGDSMVASKESYVGLLKESATDFIVDFVAFSLIFGGFALIIYLYVRQSKRH